MQSKVNNYLYTSLVLFFAITCSLFAQEKKKAAPKPQQFAVPVDTVAEDSSAKSESKKADAKNLNLPDVLIVGKDAEKHLGGTKIQHNKNLETELIKPMVIYSPMQMEQIEQGDRQAIADDAELASQQLDGYLEAGKFVHYGAGIRWWQELSETDLDYSLEGQYQSHEGDLLNQEHQEYRLGILAGGAIQQTGRWNLALRNSTFNFGLYGIENQDSSLTADREGSFTNLNAQTRVRIFGDADLRVNLGLKLSDFNTDHTNFSNEINNQAVEASLNLLKSFEKQDVNIKVEMEKGSLDGESIVNGDYQFASAGLSVRRQLSQKIIAEIGLGTNAVEMAGESKSAFAPKGELLYLHSNMLSLQINGASGYLFKSPENMFLENMYQAGGFPPSFVKQKWQVSGELNWRPQKQFSFNAMYSVQRFENQYFYSRNTDGLFDVNYIDAQLALMRIGFVFTPSSHLKVESNLEIVSDKINLDNAYRSILDLPYLSPLKSPNRIVFQPTKKWEIAGEVEFIDKRSISLDASRKLDAYLNTNAHALYKIDNHFNVYAKANNLTNTEFELWEGYPSLGFQIIGGVSARW